MTGTRRKGHGMGFELQGVGWHSKGAGASCETRQWFCHAGGCIGAAKNRRGRKSEGKGLDCTEKP